MNYKKLYDKIIEKRQKDPINEGYSENHHIKPKSLGGSDNLDNLVRLSAREHFICHYLLAKMYKKGTFEWYKMNYAFQFMKAGSMTQERYFNSRLYEALRGNFSTVMSFAQSGKKNSQYGTCWVCNLENKENKKVPKQDLELWKTKGWVKGRNKWKVSFSSNEYREQFNYPKELVVNGMGRGFYCINKTYYENLYFEYKKTSWKELKEKYNLKNSQQNFSNICSKVL